MSCSRDSLQPLQLTVVNRSTRILNVHGIGLGTLSGFMLYPFDTAGMPNMLPAMTVTWTKLMSTAPYQSFAFKELMLLRLLGMFGVKASIGHLLSRFANYLEGHKVAGLSEATRTNHALRAMARSLLQALENVIDKYPSYFEKRPYVREEEWRGRKLFHLRGGPPGIGPACMEAGDELVLLCEQCRPVLCIVRRH